MTSTGSILNGRGLVLSFDQQNGSLPPAPDSMVGRTLFYHLVNVEEHPEVLPLAHDILVRQLETAGGGPDDLATHLRGLADRPAALDAVTDALSAARHRFSSPWRQPTDALTRRQVLHYFTQYMPTAFVDGCWLQAGLRVATAHLPVGASITAMYEHQLRAFVADPGRHFVGDYRAVYERMGAKLEEVSTRSFAEREDFQEGGFELPILLMALGQFPRSHPGALLGMNLAWQFLDLSAFGPSLIRDMCQAYGLPSLGEDLGDAAYLEKGRELARSAVQTFLGAAGDGGVGTLWEQLIRGVTFGVTAWTRWFELVSGSAPEGPPDPRQEMIDLLRRKAPHAHGYHSEKMIGSRRIDDHLDPANFDGPAILADLERSPWIKAGRSDRSQLVTGLVGFGGPMLAVFSPVELEIMRSWIDSLPPKGSEAAESSERKAGATSNGEGLPSAAPSRFEGRTWSRADFQRRSQLRFGSCSVRDLYYHLVNVEFFPDILPVAERFARDRLERSMAMLSKGLRPIPSLQYDPEALESWVYQKHREQIDSYRPPGVRPDAPKQAFIESTVQLAPLILIDGGWLQGMASSALIHTTVGRMLFHVLVEEIGEGNPEEHHANIYRDLLAAMGEDAPPVDSPEFAHWDRLKDSSFDVPTLWLSISCFPRHFLPEILGLNLAVELAGIGGPYMEARDTLRRLGFPTLFVDVHNAADNVSVGHSAWAMNTIKRYLDDVAERNGPHSVDHAWHRVWSGVRATLPQIGRGRLFAHRIARRLFAPDPRLVPLIFPS